MWKNLVKAKKKRGTKYEYESEKLPYLVAIHRNYIPDLVIQIGKKKIYVEIKGYFRREDMAKMRHVKNTNPDLDIRMLFPQDNKCVGAKKMRYSDWCKRYGFPYHIGTAVPKEWLQ